MLKLYGCPNTRSLRAAWALEEAGADYVFEKIDLFKREHRQPGFVAINPGAKVPVLVTNDMRISETGAILIYLGERFPASGLLPPATQLAARVACLEWCCFVLTELEQPLWTIAKHRFALPEDWRQPPIEATAIKEFQRAANVAETRLADREFACGEHFTIADILLAHTLAWAQSARVPFSAEKLLAHHQRMWARPARARADARERGEHSQDCG